MNYPLCGTWSGIKVNCVYVADLLDNDVIIVGIEDGAGVAVEKLDYPAAKMTRLLYDHSMRTLMLYRPTLPSNYKMIIIFFWNNKVIQDEYCYLSAGYHLFTLDFLLP